MIIRFYFSEVGERVCVSLFLGDKTSQVQGKEKTDPQVAIKLGEKWF